MLKAVKMAKARIICIKKAAPSVIKLLHELSVLHITDFSLPKVEKSGPLASYDEISSRLIKIRSMKEAFGKTAVLPKKKIAVKEPIEEAEKILKKADELAGVVKEKEEAEKELDVNLALQKALADLSGITVDFSVLRQQQSLQFLLLKAGKNKAKLAENILSKLKNCSFMSTDAKEGKIFLIGLPKENETKFLEGFGQILSIPQISTTVANEISSLKEKEREIRKRKEALAGKLNKLAEKLYPHIIAAEEALSIEADRAQIAITFGATESLYYIEGWVEAKKFERLEKELKEKFGKKAIASKFPVAHGEMPPTELSNPPVAKPFQFLVELISRPSYFEVDPSIILTFAVPLIYALIMGDAGYAVLSFLIAIWLTKRSKKGGLMHQVASMWAICAIPAFFAGIAFDEYFGFQHYQIIGVKLYEGFHRVAELSTLMLISIIVGMVHLALGFILGAINEWHHSKRHATAKISWLGIEISGFFLISSFVFNTFTILSMPAIALFVLSFICLVATEGALSAIEISSLLGNVMSYIRITAVGVAGVILAGIINEMLLPRFELSLLGIILFLATGAIYIFMHIASCIVAMFESFVHGARLNVVEFFGKFYKGSGVRFSPFSFQRLYTKEV